MVWVDSLSMCGFKWIFGQMDGWCLGSLGDVDGDGYCARFGVRLRRREGGLGVGFALEVEGENWKC